MISVVLRIVALAVLLLTAWWAYRRGMSEEAGLSGVGPLILMFMALIGAAAIVARPVAALLGTLCSRLFMPGEYFDRPQPMYSIPEGRLNAGDYEGALQAYADIAGEHRQEIVPYLRMMEIYLTVYRDEAAARHIHEQGLANIEGKKNKAGFEAAAQALWQGAAGAAGGAARAEDPET